MAAVCPQASGQSPPDGTVVKAVLREQARGENLLQPDAWRPYEEGFQKQGDTFACRNTPTGGTRRGAVQTIELNQTRPDPIIAVAESRAENVSGTADTGYSIYLDLQYADGTPLWGQTAAFTTGTHDWQQRRVVVFPEKPVKRVSYYLLFREHEGTAAFRNPHLSVLETTGRAVQFDGVPCIPQTDRPAGFSVRDVGADSDFVAIQRYALDLELQTDVQERGDSRIIDVTLRNRSNKDRAVTLVYSVPVPKEELSWLADPRRSEAVEPRREYMTASRFNAGVNGRLSRYPLAAVANRERGWALGIDMRRPAFYRLGYNSGSEELFLAYDLALVPEKPEAVLRLVVYPFAPKWHFRAALARYYELFPECFQRRIEKQGLWMPFARISEVQGWEDFGFRFKEGTNETAWDDAHNILTFRYTEPMTWWMRMPDNVPRTVDAAVAFAEDLAQQGNQQARAWETSRFETEHGGPALRLLDTPWCNGAVWSMNSIPQIPGEITDFKLKWNEQIRRSLYGGQTESELDGEYVDSSEGYVTDELDFRRDHFVGERPLVFSFDRHKPAVFRGLIAFEYVREIAQDVHADGKYMMANGAPTRLCWLTPFLDVLGTETNWNRGGNWRPMPDAELLYRRSLSGQKPYCFLMNTEFSQFGPELAEKYMKRSLAYGMFPGFFSANASEGHYFTRPELYNRDRPLFRKYLPLCQRVAEAGWQPITQARCDDEEVYVERFGNRYFTIFNNGESERTVTVRWEEGETLPQRVTELVTGEQLPVTEGAVSLPLGAEDVAVLDIVMP